MYLQDVATPCVLVLAGLQEGMDQQPHTRFCRIGEPLVRAGWLSYLDGMRGAMGWSRVTLQSTWRPTLSQRIMALCRCSALCGMLGRLGVHSVLIISVNHSRQA